jgi:hypothetical protein
MAVLLSRMILGLMLECRLRAPKKKGSIEGSLFSGRILGILYSARAFLGFQGEPLAGAGGL